MRGINRNSVLKLNNNSQITPLRPLDVPVVASPPSSSRPAARAPQRAYSQANPGLQLGGQKPYPVQRHIPVPLYANCLIECLFFTYDCRKMLLIFFWCY